VEPDPAPTVGTSSSGQPRLLDRVRSVLRARHLSPRTETAYVAWIRRFILFHGKRHPDAMGESEIGAFLSSLASERTVSASTQNQALAALLFLYARVLGRKLAWIEGVTRAKRPERLPVVLTRAEVQAVIARVPGPSALICRLLYGSGLRLNEALTLRVKDIDLESCAIHVRDGKGRKDRRTVLPQTCVPPLRRHLERVRETHRLDLAEGAGRVALPDALRVKYPAAPG
jgi:integron integrase